MIEYLSIYFHVLTSRIENFESILDFNSLTRLEYSDWTSQLNLNTQIKNFDSNRVLTSRELDLTSMIRLDAISLNLSCNAKASKSSLITWCYHFVLIHYSQFFNLYKVEFSVFCDDNSDHHTNLEQSIFFHHSLLCKLCRCFHHF